MSQVAKSLRLMQIFHDIREAHLSGPTYITIGNFDGIHLGHQMLLRTLQHLSHSSQSGSDPALTAILTFDPHPLTVLKPEIGHHILTTPEERLELASELGIDVGIIQPFTRELAALKPREFMGLLKQHLGLAGLVVGPDFALGRNRSGNLDRLRAIGEELGYSLTVVQPVSTGDEEVRSFRIRQLLTEGQVAHAARLLGRNYRVAGVVVEGDKRGRQIGIHTANLQLSPPDRLLPADGVYATRTWLGKPHKSEVYASVTNIGVRPTVDGTHHTVETHLLDFPRQGQSGNLYGAELTIEFLAHLRGEKRFASLDELVAQIHQDIEKAREINATIR